MQAPRPALSIVATLYRSEATLAEFHARATAAARAAAGDDYEVVLVNDGSPDRSLEIAIALHEQDPHVRVVDLSRNFGHHKAMMTGLEYARGALVFLIDCDLEEAPELLAEFDAERRKTGADVVYGVQTARKGGLFERLSGWLFFTLFNLLSRDRLPVNLLTVRLMTRRYVDSLVAHRERAMMMAGLFVITGYRQEPLAVTKGSKPHSSYTFARKIAMFVDSVTSFSDRPLVYIFYLGSFIVLTATAAAIWLVHRKIWHGVPVAGYPSLIVSIWMLGGLTIFCIGLVGIYLSKVFIEAKQRPYTIVRATYESGSRIPNLGS
jgi:putative glycosyltransferase